MFALWYNALRADGRNSVHLRRMPVSVQETRNLMSVPIALCSLQLFGYMALTDRLAGDYRSQRRYSADKKRYPSGLVSDKTPTPFYGSGGKQFLRYRGLRRWVQKNNCFVELWPERKLSSRRRLSLFIISGFSAVCGGALYSHRCFCYAFYRMDKSVISIPFFGHFLYKNLSP